MAAPATPTVVRSRSTTVRWIETCDGPVNPGAWMIAATRRVTPALPDIRPIPTRTTPAFRPSCYAGSVTCSAGNLTCSAGNLTCYDIENDLLCKAISQFDTMAGSVDFPAIALQTLNLCSATPREDAVFSSVEGAKSRKATCYRSRATADLPNTGAPRARRDPINVPGRVWPHAGAIVAPPAAQAGVWRDRNRVSGSHRGPAPRPKARVIVIDTQRLCGAVEKTRTSTGFRPQRPQRCASTSSATTARG